MPSNSRGSADCLAETGNWFDPSLTVDSVKDDPGNLKTLDVNVRSDLLLLTRPHD